VRVVLLLDLPAIALGRGFVGKMIVAALARREIAFCTRIDARN